MGDAVIIRLRGAINDAGSLSVFSKHHGLHIGYVCEVRSGKREPSQRLMAVLGYDSTSPDWPSNRTRVVNGRELTTWTPGLLQRVCKLRDDGLTDAEMAESLGVSVSALLSAATRHNISLSRGTVRVCWTATLLAELRNLRDRGLTQVAAAECMGVGYRSLRRAAKLHSIKFRGNEKSIRVRQLNKRMRDLDIADLDSEIAIAHSEVPAVPFHQGGWM